MFTIFKRELKSYFTQPTAYAIIVIFLLFAMGFTFTFGKFIPVGDASVESSFLFWHPWFYMLLAPAVGMRLWADEQRFGTIELLGTFPIPTWKVIAGKYLASVSVWLIALLLTFPIVITVNYLGKPDNGAVFSGYLGSFLVCCTFLAVTMLVSAFTRDQVVCLIVSISICVLMVLCGYNDVTMELAKIVPASVLEVITSFGVWSHFSSLTRGMFRFQDLVWFASLISISLLGTSAILSARRA